MNGNTNIPESFKEISPYELENSLKMIGKDWMLITAEDKALGKVNAMTASWGGLLRQAFDNPLDHWHLTFFPGAALFLAVIAFNFLGEGMRRALDVR